MSINIENLIKHPIKPDHEYADERIGEVAEVIAVSGLCLKVAIENTEIACPRTGIPLVVIPKAAAEQIFHLLNTMRGMLEIIDNRTKDDESDGSDSKLNIGFEL